MVQEEEGIFVSKELFVVAYSFDLTLRNDIGRVQESHFVLMVMSDRHEVNNDLQVLWSNLFYSEKISTLSNSELKRSTKLRISNENILKELSNYGFPGS